MHNGVIWNHKEVRQYFNDETQEALPEVDSSVIGAVIETFGIDTTSVIEGDAATAWFDTDTGDTIHLARFQNSPVHFATLMDGSFVFASTAAILAGALKKVNQAWFGSYPSPFDSMAESEYFQIMAGEVVTTLETEWGEDNKYGYNWRSTTSGATTQQSPATSAAVQSSTWGQKSPEQKSIEAPKPHDPVTTPPGVNPQSAPMALIKDGELTTEGKRVFDEVAKKAKQSTYVSESLRGSEDASFTDDMNPDYDDPDYEDDSEDTVAPFQDEFFAWGHDGDFTTYTTLSGLLAALSWTSKLTGGENYLVEPDAGYERWVNHFADIGSLSKDGTDELSWVKTPGAFEPFEKKVPVWVRDGIGKLRNLVGA